MRLIKEKQIVNDAAKVDPFSMVISSCLFVGYIPKASGTFGSLFALIFFLIPGFGNIPQLFIWTLIATVIGIFTSSRMTDRYGDDPSVVVIDELAGMWLTIALGDLYLGGDITIAKLVIYFFAFRVFDVLKLQPAKWLDNMHNGFGIMMDDIVSAVYAAIFSVIVIMLMTNFQLL